MNLRDSLNPDLIGFDGQGKITLPKPAFEAVHAAARRLLALTETGPDYEAAKCEFLRLFPNKAPSYDLEDRMLVGEVIKPIVDAALADYLTELSDHSTEIRQLLDEAVERGPRDGGFRPTVADYLTEEET